MSNNCKIYVYCENLDPTPPDPPTNVVGVVGDSQIDLSWENPESNNDKNITDYIIQYSSDYGSNWISFNDLTSTNTFAVIDNLSNGLDYVFRVAAINDSGQSSFSVVSSQYTPRTTPSAPTITNTETNLNKIIVSFQAPNDNGGVLVTDYIIQYSNNNGVSWESIDYRAPSPLFQSFVVEIPDLNYGDSYIVRIAGVNLAGTGVFSSNSDNIVIGDIPDSPDITSTQIGDESVTVNWTLPNDNGSEITNYILEFADVTNFVDLVSPTWVVSDNNILPDRNDWIFGPSSMVDSLTNGNKYLFRVSAENSIGISDYSQINTYSLAIPGTVPNPPTNVFADPGDAFVFLTWEPPTVNGGYSITEYSVQYSDDNGLSWTEYSNFVSIESFEGLTISNLVNDTEYIFRVSATNDIGESNYSQASSPVTPALNFGPIENDYVLTFIDEAHPLYVIGTGNVGSLWCSDVTYYRQQVGDNVDPNSVILFDVDTPVVVAGNYRGEPISEDPFFVYPTGVNSSSIPSCYMPIPEKNITGIRRPSGGIEYKGSIAKGDISAETFATGIVTSIETIWGTGFWGRLYDSTHKVYNRKCKLYITRGHSPSLGSGVLHESIEIFKQHAITNKGLEPNMLESYINNCGERYFGWITDVLVSQGQEESCVNMYSIPDITKNNAGITNDFGDRTALFYFDNLCSGTIDDQLDGNFLHEGLSLRIHPMFSCTGIYNEDMPEDFNDVNASNNLLAEWNYYSDPGYMSQNPYNRTTQPFVGNGEIYLYYERGALSIVISGNCYDDLYVPPSNSVPGTYYVWRTTVALNEYGFPSGVIQEPYPYDSGAAPPIGGSPIGQLGSCVPSFPNIKFLSFNDETNIDPCDCLSIGTLGRHIMDAVDERILNVDPILSKPIYTTQDHDNETYIRNVNCWVADLDLTCISPWNSTGQNLRAGTLISPRHVLFCKHFGFYPANNSQIRFITENNVVINKVIDNILEVPEADFAIGVLDSDIPSTLSFAKILPQNWKNYILKLNVDPMIDSDYRLPVFATDQEEKALIRDLVVLDAQAAFKIPTNVNRLNYYEGIVGGDSGNPVFLIINNELVIITVWSNGGPGAGSNIVEYKDQINQIMNNLGGGYNLIEMDLSSFPTF